MPSLEAVWQQGRATVAAGCSGTCNKLTKEDVTDAEVIFGCESDGRFMPSFTQPFEPEAIVQANRQLARPRKSSRSKYLPRKQYTDVRSSLRKTAVTDDELKKREHETNLKYAAWEAAQKAEREQKELEAQRHRDEMAKQEQREQQEILTRLRAARQQGTIDRALDAIRFRAERQRLEVQLKSSESDSAPTTPAGSSAVASLPSPAATMSPKGVVSPGAAGSPGSVTSQVHGSQRSASPSSAFLQTGGFRGSPEMPIMPELPSFPVMEPPNFPVSSAFRLPAQLSPPGNGSPHLMDNPAEDIRKALEQAGMQAPSGAATTNVKLLPKPSFGSSPSSPYGAAVEPAVATASSGRKPEPQLSSLMLAPPPRRPGETPERVIMPVAGSADLVRGAAKPASTAGPWETFERLLSDREPVALPKSLATPNQRPTSGVSAKVNPAPNVPAPAAAYRINSAGSPVVERPIAPQFVAEKVAAPVRVPAAQPKAAVTSSQEAVAASSPCSPSSPSRSAAAGQSLQSALSGGERTPLRPGPPLSPAEARPCPSNTCKDVDLRGSPLPSSRDPERDQKLKPTRSTTTSTSSGSPREASPEDTSKGVATGELAARRTEDRAAADATPQGKEREPSPRRTGGPATSPSVPLPQSDETMEPVEPIKLSSSIEDTQKKEEDSEVQGDDPLLEGTFTYLAEYTDWSMQAATESRDVRNSIVRSTPRDSHESLGSCDGSICSSSNAPCAVVLPPAQVEDPPKRMTETLKTPSRACIQHAASPFEDPAFPPLMSSPVTVVIDRQPMQGALSSFRSVEQQEDVEPETSREPTEEMEKVARAQL
eukprot:TRINITY_DN5707_c0_g1_i3.p1 TRINITY_DN5707_c0_g1~~TRINITY_DN5707_c0_g1_i3.p1  ORF type:complete len:824 (+),score=196.30 TRINITY_DN5707_c0_g1_i3:127-2598(+)